MNYYRLFGAGLILLCCTLSGFYLSYRLKQRLVFFNDLVDFTSRLETNIRYFSDDIYKLLKLSAPNTLLPFLDKDIKPFYRYWESVAHEFTKTFRLDSDDSNKLVEFGRLLGTTDVEGQLSHIGIYKGFFAQSRDDLQKEYKTKSRLYRTLGFFAGAVAALLIL